MANAQSKSAIIKAIAGNGVITVVKGIGAIVSGSGSMVSETIHSLVDTLNQCLLLIGENRSLNAPTVRHPYGFGMEASYWGLLAAMGILAVGGGLSIEHGIAGLKDPQMPTHIGWLIGVLVFAFIVELWVLYSVFQGLAGTRADKTWLEHIKAQSPGTVTVLLEDFAAVVGCVIAGVALAMCQLTGEGIWDAIGQIVIGVLLVLVGALLLWRGRSLLLGQAIPEEKLREVREFLEDIEGLARVTDLKTRLLSSDYFTVKAEVAFSGGFLAGRFMDRMGADFAATQDEEKIKELLGRYADDLFEEQAKYIDEIEKAFKEQFPGAQYIDLEPHLHTD